MKKIVLLLCALLIFVGCYTEEQVYIEEAEEKDIDEIERQAFLDGYFEGYDDGYGDATYQIGDNIGEYIDLVVEESENYVFENLPDGQGFACDEVSWIILPYLYGEEYGEYNEEDFYYAVMQMYYFYDSFYESNTHGYTGFYRWYDGRFEKDYTYLR